MLYEPHDIKQHKQALSRCLQNGSASNVHHEPSSPLLKLTAMAKGVVHIALPIAALLWVTQSDSIRMWTKVTEAVGCGDW